MSCFSEAAGTYRGAQGVRPYPVDGWECEEPRLTPRCTVAEVWKRAIAKGAPGDNAVADINYYSWDGKSRWVVTIGDVFSQSLEDACK